MPRRKGKTTQTLPKHHSWALVPVDGRPIREKARQAYEKVLRELEKARRELEHFEKHDRPTFSQWLNRQCGALITELRETSQKLATQRELLFEIESEALLSNSSYGRAYERVMWRQAHPETEEAPPSGTGDDDQRNSRAAEEDEAFDDDFDEFYREVEEEFERAFGIPRDKKKAARSPVQPPPAPSRLKELYRALVRRLHPDTQSTLTAQKKEWWHRAQAAYEQGDVEQLQVLLTLCEIDEEGTTAKTTVSLLMRVTQEFKNALRALKNQLSHHRRDPAWNFSKLQDHRPLAARLERSMSSDLAEMKQALGVINAQIESWARQAAMGRRRTRRRRSAWGQPEFFF